MVGSGKATWPEHTTKCYFDAQDEYWSYLVDGNGTCYSDFDFEWSNASDSAGSTAMSAVDYYAQQGDPIDDDNYGWPLPLEFDEYPLEIQCSSCFLFVYAGPYITLIS